MIETATVIAVIVGVVEVIKQVGLPSKFAPLVSLLLGVLIVGAFDGFTATSLFAGVVAGLSASGLYSGGKTLLK